MNAVEDLGKNPPPYEEPIPPLYLEPSTEDRFYWYLPSTWSPSEDLENNLRKLIVLQQKYSYREITQTLQDQGILRVVLSPRKLRWKMG